MNQMSENREVGVLRRLPPREVFEHEAYDFTTWLEEHVERLGEVLGIELTAAEREKSAGDFSADLLAEGEAGRRAIIENQLAQTDHKHVGQVLTYLTVLDAEIVIWVTADARPEHVSAVSWLNESAGGADLSRKGRGRAGRQLAARPLVYPDRGTEPGDPSRRADEEGAG
jgi:hypothetical protein